jgi:hypothetical protein
MAITTVSAGGAGSAVAMHLISGATNATPIVITVAANSGLKTGDRVAISGITGNTGANGEWTLEYVSATTFKLLGSAGNGTYGGTPRLALIFDKTPLHEDHNALLTLGGNLVGTVLLEAFASYAEFAAGDNSLGGAVSAPVQTSALSFITNTNATSASLSTIASSSVVMAATAEAVPLPMKLPRYLRVSCSAYTSGSITGLICA